jgi:adenylosuccinate lyase
VIDRYRDEAATIIWSELEKYKTWAKIETVYINSLLTSDYEVFDINEEDVLEIMEIESIRKHDVASFVEWYEKKLKQVAGDRSRYVHFGLTSSDIVDTGLSMSIRKSNMRILELVDALVGTLHSINSSSHMTGRTHGRHAEPILIKDKFDSYTSVIHSLVSGIIHCEYPGRLKGPVGDMKHVCGFSRILMRRKPYLNWDVSALNGLTVK